VLAFLFQGDVFIVNATLWCLMLVTSASAMTASHGTDRLLSHPVSGGASPRGTLRQLGVLASCITVDCMSTCCHAPFFFARILVREIVRTAPYMHDGSMATLTDVVNFSDTDPSAAR
jgi:hypothetical protein